jgi:hypothetical protein
VKRLLVATRLTSKGDPMLRRFPLIWDHSMIPYQRETP